MIQLDKFLNLKKQIHEYFGFEEQSHNILPIDDCREYFWKVNPIGKGGFINFAATPAELDAERGAFYKQRYFGDQVFQGKEFTMICCDKCDGKNLVLRIFENSKEKLDV